jgi:cytidylate kinase
LYYVPVFLTGRYSSDQIKEDEMVGHVSRMMARREVYRILVQNIKRRDQSEDLVVDGTII